jgi:hypothetical protein
MLSISDLALQLPRTYLDMSVVVHPRSLVNVFGVLALKNDSLI